MNLPEDFLAARGYLAVARGDRDKGFHLSACLTAQKAAEVALQGYVRARGMSLGPETMPALVAGVPGRTPKLERAAARLERFRMDMHSPYRSAADLDDDPTHESAAACCEAAEAIVTHVASLFAAPDAPETADASDNSDNSDNSDASDGSDDSDAPDMLDASIGAKGAERQGGAGAAEAGA